MRAMLDIAQHYHEGLVLVKDVAARQQISERYLEQLCLTLKTAGLVKSTRGSRGGFTLTRSPDKIKLIDIIRVCEGPLALVDCINDATVVPAPRGAPPGMSGANYNPLWIVYLVLKHCRISSRARN